MRYYSPRLASQKRRSNIEKSSGEALRRHKPDYLLLVLIGGLLVVGAMVVYAIGPGLTSGTDLPENYYSNKQLVAVMLGVVAFVIASRTPIQRWKKYQTFIVGLAAVIAILVRFVGEEVNGAHRWIQVAGLSFQAAELVKLAIVLWMANYLASARSQKSIDTNKVFRDLGILSALIVIVVAGLQSDLGSAGVMLAIVGVMAYVAGLPMKKLSLAVVAVLLAGMLAIAVTPYRRERVKTFFNPTADCQNEGYQACQALITVGSGGMFGKGLGRSVQAYGYLPEPANDSIFAIVSEKFGFVGSIGVVATFWLLFKRIMKIAQSAPTDYSRLIVTGVLVWISVQMIINIGAMVGLLPLKGITLPFVSYGGTSIIFVLIGMGVVFEVSRYTDLTGRATSGSSTSRQNQGVSHVMWRRR